jgi:RNA polymerase sigma-70 factor (ECF subfamily)|tara:strand:- start:508 stop:1125 length:618 start_codon:yes stop_codon:yes gene_type:complete
MYLCPSFRTQDAYSAHGEQENYRHMATRAEIEVLIAQVGMRDRAAFSSLYARTSAKLFGVCLRILKDRAAAEDALQEVFVKIWYNADKFIAGGYSPMTWLITIARNHAIDRLRAAQALTQGMGAEADAVPDGGPGPEALAVAASQRAAIDGCLEELEDDKADAVRGAYLEGYSYQQLADRSGVPVNTMRTWLRRSLLKLRDCLTR